MITYTYRESSKLWDYDFGQETKPDGGYILVKRDFRLIAPVRDWLVEQGYAYSISERPTSIIFPEDSHAFAFKMRWF